jgi:hypothetical protein
MIILVFQGNYKDECHSHRVNDPTGMASNRQGSHCIDHAFATYKVSNAITRLQYEDYPQGYDTDHCPMFMHIDLAQIDGSLQIYKNPKYRRLLSKDPKNTRLYIQRKYKQIERYKIEHLISEIEERMNTCQVEQIDDQGQDLWLQIERINQHLTKVNLEHENGIK